MIYEKRKKEAHSNFSRYLQEGLLKKDKSELARNKYLENADLSLKAAFSTGVFTSGLHPIQYLLEKAVSENRPEQSEHARNEKTISFLHRN